MDSSGKPSTAQIILLATSSAVTALMYSVYRKKAATVNTLREAKKISLEQDLKDLLSEAPGKCVPYAVIEGVVRSVKETLNSQFVDNCKGVIQRLTLREKKMVWNRTTKHWNDREKIIHQRTNTVPFDLCSHDDEVTVSVRVVRPLDAWEMNLETTYETFHPTVQSLGNVIGHFISGERPQGMRETEEMLRLGECVTGVGELVLDNNIVKLQPPKQAGLHFFLSRQDYAALLAKQERSSRVWRLLAGLCGLATVAVLVYVLWRQWTRRRKQRQERVVLEEFKEEQRRRMRELQVEEEDVPAGACSICLSAQRACAFLECGHVCTCEPCYRALPQPKKCPICRAHIDRMVPLYNS